MACDLLHMLNDFFASLRSGECLLCGRSQLEQLGIPITVFKDALFNITESNLICINSIPNPGWKFELTIDEAILDVQIFCQLGDGDSSWIISVF